MNRDQPADVRLPPERFYWAVLDTSGSPRPLTPSSRRRQFKFLIEPLLPVALESVHTVFRSASDGSTVACAMDRKQLLECPEAVSLGPDTLPEFMESRLDPHTIDLLTGEFEAPHVRRSRTRWALSCCAALVVITAVVSFGIHRRASAAAESLGRLADAASAVFARVLPDSPSAQPPELRLVSERRTLELTRQAPTDELADVGTALASLLEHWPEGLNAQTQSLVVTDSVATLIAAVSTNEDAQRLAVALDSSPLWRALQPQIRLVRGTVQLTLRLESLGGPP